MPDIRRMNGVIHWLRRRQIVAAYRKILDLQDEKGEKRKCRNDVMYVALL